LPFAHAKCALTAAASLGGKELEDAVAVVATPALFDRVALPPAWASALLSLALTAPVAGASALLWWCAAEAALLCLGLAAVVVIDAPVASVLSEVAVLCLQLACLGPAAGAPYAWPALLCAPDEGPWLPGAATSVNALLPRACVPL